MDDQNEFLGFNDGESEHTKALPPYPTAAEERILWRKYFQWRRIDEILGLKTASDEVSGVDRILLRIATDISESTAVIRLLKKFSGLDRLGDKIIEDSNNNSRTLVEFYRLIQDSEQERNIKTGAKDENSFRLKELFGFIFIEMIDNIAFGRGNPDLIKSVVRATNSDELGLKTQIYRLAINRGLLPKSILTLIGPDTAISDVPRLLRSVKPSQYRVMVLNDYIPYIRKARIDGKAAFDKIIEKHIRLSAKSARIFSSRDGSLPIDDLFQEGSLGLMKAAEHFNPAYGNRFMSYAPFWIHQAIERAMADNGRVVRVPVHMVETINRFQSISQRLAQEWGREPTSREIGQRMGISPEKVREIAKTAELPVSLDLQLDEEEDLSPVDFIEDHNEPSPPDAALKQALKEQIDEVLSSLTHREQRVLELRFGLEDGRSRTLEEVGQEFNVTRERIRQIEAKALRRLRHPSRSRKLKDYL
jgi:RNA polymerase sigma factor (sigma-70 family)